MSVNIAQFAAQVAEKDSEKDTLLAEIEKIKEQQERGFIGTVSLSITHIDHLPLESDFAIHFSANEELNQAQTSLENKSLTETVTLLVKSYEQALEVRVVKDGEVFAAPVTLSDLPGDMAMTAEVDAISSADENKTIRLHYKANAGFYHLELESRERAVQQAEQELQELRAALREANKQSEASAKAAAREKGGKKKTTTKKTGKGKTSSSAKSEQDQEELPSSSSSSSSFSDIAQQAVAGTLLAGQAVLEYRAYWLFAAAAAGIYYLGDYASV
eukprot:gene11328-12643_t